MKKILIVLIWVMMISTGVQCAPVSVKTKADKTKITIGDRIQYAVEIEYEKGVTIIPFDASEKLKPFEIKKYETKKQQSFGTEIQKNIYSITIFSTGRFFIPPIEIKYEQSDLPGNKAGKRSSVFTDTVSILVESVLSAQDSISVDIKDIKPPIKSKTPVLMYILIFIGAAAAAYIIWIKLKKEENGFFGGENLEKTPYELALERLKKLESMDLAAKGEIKQYYIIFSEIIRRYIEGRYGIPAVERTTSELYQEMRTKEIERKVCMFVKELMDGCDLVKFAKFVPSEKETGQDLKKAYELLEMTKILTTDEHGFTQI